MKLKSRAEEEEAAPTDSKDPALVFMLTQYVKWTGRETREEGYLYQLAQEQDFLPIEEPR